MEEGTAEMERKYGTELPILRQGNRNISSHPVTLASRLIAARLRCNGVKSRVACEENWSQLTLAESFPRIDRTSMGRTLGTIFPEGKRRCHRCPGALGGG